MAQAATDPASRGTGSNLQPMHVKSVVDKLVPRQVLLRVTWSSPVTVTPVGAPGSFIHHCRYVISLSAMFLNTYLLTHSMEQSLSREANWFCS